MAPPKLTAPPPEPPGLSKPPTIPKAPTPLARPKTPTEVSAELDRELSQLSVRQEAPEAPMLPLGDKNLPTRYAVIGAVVGFIFCMGFPGMAVGGYLGWQIGKKQQRGA
ncbi:MAG: hypothetical protein H6741_09900 [Alphaproteobacteria bacterium]|nr:hypothetical protein [Alphaproteobacteria bacterium]